jgi:hypothetical protein
VQLFIDNDILLKLGSASLLQNLNKIFNVSNESIYILSTAKHYISNNKNLEKKYSKKTLAQILEAINKYSIIPDEYLDQETFLKLSNILNIDTGEQILFSIRPPSDEFHILTGDKLSIQALYSNLAIEGIATELKNKIVCLEYLFLRFIQTEKIESFSAKIKEASFCGDKVLELIFNQTFISKEIIIEGLLSYFNDINNRINDNLFKDSFQ